MRIAIVDYETKYSSQLQSMISQIAEEKEINLQVEAFGSGEKLITALESTRYDVVFMDVYLPGMDGIETAKKLRVMTQRTFLIFVTESDEHYQDAFSLHAFDYVIKPFTKERIERVIKEIFEHSPLDEAFVKISIGQMEYKILLKTIQHVTTDAHYLEISRTDSENILRVRMTMKEFMRLSGNDPRFVTVNRGILANCDYIESYDTNEVKMKDGLVFPVTSLRSAEVVQKIYNYLYTKKH